MRFLLFIFVILFLYSCNNFDNHSIDCDFKLSSNETEFSIDSIGIYHNLMLNNVINNLNENNIELTGKERYLNSLAAEVSRKAKDFSLFGYTVDSSWTYDFMVRSYTIDEFNKSPIEFRIAVTNLIDSVYSQDVITLSEKVLIEEVFDSIYEGKLNYNYFKLKWCTIEKNESKGVISASIISVGYHSSLYWREYYSNLNSNFEINNRAAPFIIAGADALGALEGGVTWAFGKTVMGGWGQPDGRDYLEGAVSIVTGAVSGSVGGYLRAVKYAKKAWDWYW